MQPERGKLLEEFSHALDELIKSKKHEATFSYGVFLAQMISKHADDEILRLIIGDLKQWTRKHGKSE